MWDTNIHWIQFALNTARHESTKSSPFSLFHCFVSNNPLSNLWSVSDLLPEVMDTVVVKENWTRVWRNLQAAHERVSCYYNPLHCPSPFKVDDVVMLRNNPKSSAIHILQRSLLHAMLDHS